MGEIWNGETATRRSDVYSLGALIYELCAGQTPNKDLEFPYLAIGIQEREDAEDLVVERAFKNGPADAMAETARFSPGFFQHAIESFQGELATVFCDPSRADDARGLKIGRDKHRIPGDVHRFVDERRGTVRARLEHLCFGVQLDSDNFVFVFFEDLSDLREFTSDPKNILSRIEMHLSVWLNIIVELYHPRFFGRENGTNFAKRPGEVVTIVIQ